MAPTRNFLYSVLVLFGLTSCIITDQIRTVEIEIMKPGIFIFPESINKVAIIKRDLYQSDTAIFKYLMFYRYTADSTIKYSRLSNRCVDALSNYLKDEGYFKQVVNYRDSLNCPGTKGWLADSEELIRNTQADVFIFLDFLNFGNTEASSTHDYAITTSYLSWTIQFKEDTTLYVYNQVDTLFYGGDQLANSNLNGISSIMENATDFAGKSFGTKLIPSWVPVERMYYKSNHPEMLKAEAFARKFDWLHAAEIWNCETNNKNQQIAAKACYNMALACEMEGKYDLAIDWLVKSYSILSKNNEVHKLNCQRYINLLAIRKKEIKRLEKQIRVKD